MSSIAALTDSVKQQLILAQQDGATVTVRYHLTREARLAASVTGRVAGFTHRPRCAEKVRVMEAGQTIPREVALQSVVAIARRVEVRL